ncbi:hypothetical protein ACFL2W_00125 [Candidatus Omnitrophota bacterium]
MGMTKREVDRKLDNIVAFSELEEFLSMRLKYFSTGMRARLGFSIMVQAPIDIILLDEFLAVGDIYFREKCFQVLEGFTREGKAVILVSQSLGRIARMCTRAMLLDKGEQVIEGDVHSVVEKYRTLHRDD